MARFFCSIYDYFAAHKRAYWCTLITLFIIVGFGASRIKFETNINKMIPHDSNIEAMNNILNHTKSGEQLIFTLKFKDTNTTNPDALILRQQALQTALEKLQGRYIKSITSIQDSEKEQQMSRLALDYLPLFLEDKDYLYIDSMVNTAELNAHFTKLKNLLLSPAGMVAKINIASDPLYFTPLVLKKFQTLNFDPNYELYNGYIFNNNLQKLTFLIEPIYPAGETGKNKPFINALDQIVKSFEDKYGNTKVQYFGGAAVGVANADQMQQDTILTLSLTVILLLALTYYVFRRKRISFIIIVPVLFGALFGMSITALFIPKVSVIAIGAGAIILGIAVDFSVHFMSHTRTAANIRATVKELSLPLTLGAITTIGAFYALRFANAPLLQDLGTFAAFALLGAALFTLIFLPHISPKSKVQTKSNIIDKLAAYKPENNKWLLVLVVLLTPILWYFGKDVSFNSDLMQLNYMSKTLREAEAELNKDNTLALSSVFALSSGDSFEAAQQKMEGQYELLQNLREKGAIKSAVVPTLLLPSELKQKERIEKWKTYWSNDKIKMLYQGIQTAAGSAGFSSDAFEPFLETLQKDYSTFDTAASLLLKELMPASFVFDGRKYYIVSNIKVNPGKRAEVLAALNASEELISTDRQSVSEKLLDLLQSDFNRLLFISGGLVFLALLIAYGRIELAIISFLPMAVSWVWITGMMSILGLQFNVVNIVIATLLFGLGDDYSIFMMDSLMEKYRTGKSHVHSARSAVYLSVLTTITGLGTLIFAVHPALKSIAAIAIVGLICVVFVSQVLQPFLFNFFIQSRANKGYMPFTLLSFMRSVASFSYFVLGCLLVSIAGLFLIKFRLLGKKKSKLVFHWLLSKYTGSVMRLFHKLNFKIIKDAAVDFSTPAVYIANHSSFLDILLITMMHPKLVLLTNKWVYRSPIFGAVVRMAEYYPVADGAEGSIAPLRDLVNRGYSIAIFPEGTRSKTDKIARFHKGAFYISEQLNLNVVPIILHGVHYKMQKGDFLLKKGPIHMELLQPIKPRDREWGTSLKERTKSISKYFKQTFEAVKNKVETPSYFRTQLIRGYTYKGPVIEWYCRIKTKMEDNYELLDKLLPKEGRFYDLGCGYGFAAYILHWTAPKRTFQGVDYDEEKIITAQHHYKSNSATQFVSADITQYDLEPCDGIIINDVLHYLKPEQQIRVLNKCFEALLDGGMLIIRDGMKDLAERHKGTERTEQWSTQWLNFNKTQNELHFLRQSDLEKWAQKKGMSIRIIDNTKRTSNIILVMQKKENGIYPPLV
jgi:1-acyl-sn-glycerol-3-phosphate acyltransferase